ncbi:hypothetical protein [Yoonia sp.]|uniref:hypothetical protein n=1 Tax=Yoonia sp. TaxID=2212373 RepID=UPI0025D79950|nr:hypothetical protein [Yoonia sp.]
MSSVRKFVSQDDRTVLRAPTQQELEDGLDKFVLTSAFRVEDELFVLPPETDTQNAAAAKPRSDNVLVLEPARRSDRAGLEATIAELEAAVTARPDEWEPDDGEGLTDAAWEASAFHLHTITDAAEPQDERNFDTGSQADLPPAADAASLENASLINPDALRALVVEVIREELNGEIGERMTRNVRKLVRREINRLLISRELD